MFFDVLYVDVLLMISRSSQDFSMMFSRCFQDDLMISCGSCESFGSCLDGGPGGSGFSCGSGGPTGFGGSCGRRGFFGSGGPGLDGSFGTK